MKCPGQRSESGTTHQEDRFYTQEYDRLDDIDPVYSWELAQRYRERRW